MSYPYPELTNRLEFLCNLHKYKQIVAPLISPKGRLQTPPKDHPYWHILPKYPIAECPICAYRLQNLVDTYSLLGWGSSFHGLLQSLYRSDMPAVTAGPVTKGTPKFAHCPHFMGIHSFLNLHEVPPPNTYYWSNRTGEVPYITPWFFPDDVPTYAVLHALPICRIEEDTFVPTYTVFSITYFSQDRKEILMRWRERVRNEGLGDPEYYPSLLAMPNSYSYEERSAQHDLVTWARQGKLGFLDVTRPMLPLFIGPGTELPEIYQHIQGRLATYTWSRGRLKSF